MQYMGLSVFSLPISLWMFVGIGVLYFIIIKSEVWSICHCLELGHEKVVCTVCPSMFIWFYGYSDGNSTGLFLSSIPSYQQGKEFAHNVRVTWLLLMPICLYNDGTKPLLEPMLTNHHTFLSYSPDSNFTSGFHMLTNFPNWSRFDINSVSIPGTYIYEDTPYIMLWHLRLNI